MIRTPKQPSGQDYEDYVVAWLQALGYFTETRLILKEGSSELLELDVVASPSGTGGNSILVDAKKGTPRYRDAFTLFGWRSFLGLERACIVHQSPLDPQRKEGFDRLQKDTEVYQTRLDPEDPQVESPFQVCTTVGEERRQIAASAAWFKQIALRLAYAELLHQARSQPENNLLQLAKSYHSSVQGSFFAKTPLGRSNSLYEAYQDAPRLSGSLIKDYATRKGVSARSAWRQVFSSGTLGWIQYVMLLEHRARTAVLKNAIDHLYSADPDEESTRPVAAFRSFLHLLTPTTFRTGLEHLQSVPEPFKVPAFFQQFVEILGGWYRPDSEDEELVATITGVSSEQIDDYLSLLDHFFPFGDTWLHSMQGLRMIKLVPGIVRGAGCFTRQEVFELDSYRTWLPAAARPLGGWHNSLYTYLEPYLGVDDEQE